MKSVLTGLIMLASISASADPCLKTLEKKFTYDRLVAVSVTEAKGMVKEALPDDGDDALDIMKGLLDDKNTLFYALNWTAPGNAGVDLIAADKNTCKVSAQLMIWSEE